MMQRWLCRTPDPLITRINVPCDRVEPCGDPLHPDHVIEVHTQYHGAGMAQYRTTVLFDGVKGRMLPRTHRDFGDAGTFHEFLCHNLRVVAGVEP